MRGVHFFARVSKREKSGYILLTLFFSESVIKGKKDGITANFFIIISKKEENEVIFLTGKRGCVSKTTESRRILLPSKRSSVSKRAEGGGALLTDEKNESVKRQ